MPVAILKGLKYRRSEMGTKSMIMPREKDLFR